MSWLTSPHSSRMSRNSVLRSVGKRRLSQSFLRRRCNNHCRGSSATRQLALSSIGRMAGRACLSAQGRVWSVGWCPGHPIEYFARRHQLFAHPPTGRAASITERAAALFERRCHRAYVLLHCRLVSVPQAQVGPPMHVTGPARERLRHVGASTQPNANFLRLGQRPEMPRLILGFVRQPPALPANNTGSDGIKDSTSPTT